MLWFLTLDYNFGHGPGDSAEVMIKPVFLPWLFLKRKQYNAIIHKKTSVDPCHGCHGSGSHLRSDSDYRI